MKGKNFIIAAIFFIIINLIAQALGILNIHKIIPWILEKAPMEGTIFEVHYSYGGQIFFKGFLSLFALLITPFLAWVVLVLLEALSALSQCLAKIDCGVFLSFLETEDLEKNIFLTIIEKIFFLVLFPLILVGVILKRVSKILGFLNPLVV